MRYGKNLPRILFVVVWAVQATLLANAKEGDELLGKPAPAWEVREWVNSDRLQLEDLRGKAVLIRFWTNTCPYCAASMPALEQIHEEFNDKGLRTIGFYHPKPYGTKRSRDSVEEALKEMGVTFPVALDSEWKNLQRYWLSSGKPRNFTSVSFLLDQYGTIRFIHPGPEYYPASNGPNLKANHDYDELTAAIKKVLKLTETIDKADAGALKEPKSLRQKRKK